MNLALLATLYRRLVDHKARRTRATAITHNGGRRRVYGCICGAAVSMCAAYPVTRRVLEFRDAHDGCLVSAVAAHLPHVLAAVVTDPTWAGQADARIAAAFVSDVLAEAIS